MTNQNKSAQARQRRRSSDGRFADEDKQDSLPSDTKIQQVASLLTDDTEPDFNQLLTATGAFDDPYEHAISNSTCPTDPPSTATPWTMGESTATRCRPAGTPTP